MKNLVPFLLIAIGMTMVIAASAMPLFGWNVSIETTDFSPSYRLDLEPSPWVTRLGESLDDKLIVFRRISIYQGDRLCFEGDDVDVVIERPAPEASLDHFWTQVGKKSSSWLVLPGIIGAIVASAYMVCMTLLVDKKPFSEVALAGLGGVGICAISIVVLALLGPSTSFPHPASLADNCVGSLTLRASLLRSHWETVATLVTGVVLEALAVALMVRGLAIALWHGKKNRMAG